MLILKLSIVPLALWLFGVLERAHGPRVAGWLSGFPIVGGPMLAFITLEHGQAFGSQAALGAYFGLVPWLAFTGSYALCARRLHPIWCILVSFSMWTATAYAIVLTEGLSPWLEVVPFAAFLAAQFAYPRGEPSDEEREHTWWTQPARMLAGAGLTVAITQFAAALGTHWSGLFSTFPVMGSIICISSHVEYGRHAVQEAVAGMTMGLASVGTFCFALYLLLARMEMWPAFGLSLVISTSAHALTWVFFKARKA